MSQGFRPSLADTGVYTAVSLAVLILSSLMMGCIGKSDDQFEWPDMSENDCDFSGDYQLNCSLILDGLGVPVISLKHPILRELWIADLDGRIIVWDGDARTEIGNLSTLISRCHNEQGLLSFAFADSFLDSNEILVSYTDADDCDGPNNSDLVLASIIVSGNGTLDISSLKILNRIEQPYRNHNGGHILSIGNGQYLLGVGDGGSSGDPENNGQNLDSKLGSIIFFNYDGESISPVLNHSSGDPFILYSGLRNPWRFDIDDMGNVWIADVGQYCWEEVNRAHLSQRENFGWSEMEGFQEYSDGASTGNCDENYLSGESDDGINSEFTDPLVVYGHYGGNCSITGGHWLEAGPNALRDSYVYGDFCSGTIWSVTENNESWGSNLIGTTGIMIVGFGKGLEDSLLIFDWSGRIFEISS